MSVRGKKRDDWVALTLTDFGDPARREVLRHHFSVEAAYRAWAGILSIYDAPWREKAKVWQETRDGQVINSN